MPGRVHSLKFTTVLLVTLAAMSSSPNAQTVRGLDAPEVNSGPPAAADADTAPSFLIEPDAQIKGNQIKQKTYRSQAIGRNKNLDLDIGGFQAPINEDPNQLAEDLEDSSYSGMRLRLPLRGRTRQ